MNDTARLIDSHGRRLNYLRISITDRCNLRCAYCMPSGGVGLLPSGEILSFEEIIRVVEAALRLGVDKLRITGGEPLVRKGAVELIERLIAMDAVKDFGLTTNGALLTENIDSLWNAGLRRINVSLDTLDPDKYRLITRGGNIDDALNGIKSATYRGFSPIKVNVVAFKGFNDDEVADFGRMARELPLVIRFIEHMRLTDCEVGSFLSGDEILEKIALPGELEEIPMTSACETARRFRFRDGRGEIGLISPLSHKFCSGCNRLRLNADGAIQSCLLNSAITDIKKPLRNGASAGQLMAILREAAMKKPSEHNLAAGDNATCSRAMPIVGG